MEKTVEDNACRTQIKVVKCNYKWVIENFKYCCEETGEFFKSTKFFAAECENLQWSLRIYPNGFNEESKEFVSLYLHLESGNEPDIKANMHFSILDADGKDSNCTKDVNKKAFKCEKDTIRGENHFISRDILLDEVNKLLPDNKLTISCEISLVQRVTVNEQGDIVTHKLSSSVILKNDFDDSDDASKVPLDTSIKLKYTLSIPSFVNCPEMPKIIESPTFSAQNIGKFLWFLRVYPEGLCEKDSVSVYLYLESNNEPESGVKGSISIQDENGAQIVACSLRPMTHAPIPSYYAHFAKTSFIKTEENLVLGNDLTLVCEIELESDGDYKSDSNKNLICKDLPVETSAISNADNIFSNVILEVDGREFRGHKAILAAKSRFFAAIFDNETDEEKSDSVIISDVDYDVFQEVLRFIYTGEAQNLEKVAVRLLTAAEKFSLEKLKIKCEETIAVKNVCQTSKKETSASDTLFTPN